ncbi:MAG: hypothetical protein IPN76_20545 [Saprospiraceae bacterium]|nr:hypothetical protein [Saprospiraceae bacterium]
MKSIIAMASLLSLAIISSAFIQKPIPAKTIEKYEKKEPFLEFLSQFKKVELPYSIGLNDLEGYQAYRDIKSKPTAKSIKKTALKTTQFIPASMAGKLSRMGPPTLYPVARFYPNHQMVAVVYKSQGPFDEEIYASYSLILYDLKGNILPRTKDKMGNNRGFRLAHSAMENSLTCTIDATGNISQTEFKNVWKKDVYEHGFEGNKLVDFKAGKTTYFALDSKGNLNETKYTAMASRARP